MFVVTRFCVQAFLRKRGALVAEVTQQFRTRNQAVEAGARAERWAAGVVVYQVDGETASGFWRDPRIISSAGDTPPMPWRSAGPKQYGAAVLPFRPYGPSSPAA